MTLELQDRERLIRDLIVAEVLALPGRGPLARKRWPPPPAGAREIEGPLAGPRASDEDEAER